MSPLDLIGGGIAALFLILCIAALCASNRDHSERNDDDKP
jgi:hypothetical protein